jgi:S1-C subfamily serine protease
MEGSRDAMRVYLGTIPDYVANVKGLALGGVTAGSPADRGGLRAGDVIVEFGGIEIANIYDYTIALDSARVGEPVEVVVVRGGERVELTVTPAARR